MAAAVSPEAISRLAEACGQYRALVLMPFCSGLSFSEATALRRKHCDAKGGFVEVVDVAVETAGGVIFKAKKRGYAALAGIEAPADQALAKHLAAMADRSRQALVFTDEAGQPLRRGWFDEQVWRPALAAVGLDAGLAFEDLALARLRGAWADRAALSRPDQGDQERCWPTDAADEATEANLTGWREWDSVLHLLSAPCLASEAAPFIDQRRQSIDWTGLRRAGRSWSHAGRLLLGLAHNLWNSTGHICVRELVDTLDEANFARALQALAIARGRPRAAVAGGGR
jgi:hypothetical protein